MRGLLMFVVLCVLSMAACSNNTSDGVDASNDAPADVQEADTPTDINGTDESVSDQSSDAGSLSRPNILLIISDDQGLDASSQYSVGTDLPNTPVLDALAERGVVFDNAWATPACTTTRGTLITGLHGVHSGVDTVPDLLDPDQLTLHDHFSDQAPEYATAIIGKWHLGGRNPDLNGPAQSGVTYYAGTIAGVVEDYWGWTLTSQGQQSASTTYHTTAMTDLAIDWIGQQQQKPWFLWLAYVAPHRPFHLPPSNLHARTLSGEPSDIRANPRPYYLAAIEAMDAEIGRLLSALPPSTRARTLVVFVGDNGTPTQAVDASVFSPSHSKNSLYEGGGRVPLIASGAGVSRSGEREEALVNTVDFFPTFADVAGASAPLQALDGVSFHGLLSDPQASSRTHNYTEFDTAQTSGWAVRNATHKLIEFSDGTRELYDLSVDLAEQDNLIADPAYADLIEELAAFAAQVRE